MGGPGYNLLLDIGLSFYSTWPVKGKSFGKQGSLSFLYKVEKFSNILSALLVYLFLFSSVEIFVFKFLFPIANLYGRLMHLKRRKQSQSLLLKF